MKFEEQTKKIYGKPDVKALKETDYGFYQKYRVKITAQDFPEEQDKVEDQVQVIFALEVEHKNPVVNKTGPQIKD